MTDVIEGLVEHFKKDGVRAYVIDGPEVNIAFGKLYHTYISENSFEELLEMIVNDNSAFGETSEYKTAVANAREMSGYPSALIVVRKRPELEGNKYKTRLCFITKGE